MNKPNPNPFQVVIATVLLIAVSTVLAACDQATATAVRPVDPIAVPNSAVYFGIEYANVQATLAQDHAEQPQAF